MYETLIKGRTLPEVYNKALVELYTNGTSSGTDYNQDQLEISVTMVIEEPISEPMISRLFIGGPHELQQYIMEICDGILDFMIGVDENTWEYTYHNRMRKFPLHPDAIPLKNLGFVGAEKTDIMWLNQIDWVVQDLKRNPDSRRAIINIRDNSIDPFIANPACLQNIQFLIREGKLHMKVLMRSNDAPEATFMNAFAFIMFQKKIADELGVPVGSYTHRANSFHVYEKDYALLNSYIEGITNRDLDDLTYSYIDGWMEEMEECIPEINKMVEVQKNKYAIGE